MNVATLVLTDTDLGLAIEVTWPVVDHPRRGWAAADTVATVIREHIPDVVVWFTADFMGVRQPFGPDLVAIPGDRLLIIGGQVLRP